MEKYAILLGYYDKQLHLIQRLFNDVKDLELKSYENKYVFALKTQQLYTAIEDLLKQTAKAFENHIEDLGRYHKELLNRLSTEIPKIRPSLISPKTYQLLDKVCAFRHFIMHAYDCELEEKELILLQNRLKNELHLFFEDVSIFRNYIQNLA